MNAKVNMIPKNTLTAIRGKEHSLPKLQCAYCAKSFTYISNLHQHLRMCASNPEKKKKKKKNNRKQVRCIKCKKTFLSNKYLRAHVKSMHVQRQKAMCEVCGQEFAMMGSLTRHMGRKHKDNQN